MSALERSSVGGGRRYNECGTRSAVGGGEEVSKVANTQHDGRNRYCFTVPAYPAGNDYACQRHSSSC